MCYEFVQQFLIIFEQVLLYMPLMFGGYIAIGLMRIPNLSIESAFVFGALSGSIVGKALHFSAPLGFIIGIVSAAVAGSLIGVSAGLLAAYGKLSHLLSSIIMIGFTQGLALMILGGTHLMLDPAYNALNLLACNNCYPVLPMLLLVTGIIGVIIYFFLKTKLGVLCATYGDNPQFLISHRVSTTYSICMGLAIANALAGISGYLVAMNNSFIDVTMGVGMPLFCITVLMLGSSIVAAEQPIAFTLPIFGTLAYFILQSVLLKAGFDLRYFQLVQAVVLTAIFLVQQSRTGRVLGV